MKKISLPLLSELSALKGKRVLVRADYNVPLRKEGIVDPSRIEKSFKTLRYLTRAGARVILVSHWGDGELSLKPIARAIGQKFAVGFAPELFGRKTEKMIEELAAGRILMLENLRSNKGEVSNNDFFALSLSKLADIYVNEAFSASHREHASIVSVPKYLPSYAGIQFEEEVRELSALGAPERPFVFILGGAKMSTKLPLIEKYLKVADTVFVAGALMNSFFREEGFEIGRSIIDKGEVDVAPFLGHKRLMLPDDIVTEERIVKPPSELKKREAIRDIGPTSLRALKEKIKGAKTVLFNGPVGDYEKGFGETTEAIFRAMAASKAHTIVGGGDSGAILSRMRLKRGIDFVSTGGGAMIGFLATGTLPGIEALRQKKKR